MLAKQSDRAQLCLLFDPISWTLVDHLGIWQKVAFPFCFTLQKRKASQQENLELPDQFQGLQVLYLWWCYLLRGVSLHNSGRSSSHLNLPLVWQSERNKKKQLCFVRLALNPGKGQAGENSARRSLQKTEPWWGRQQRGAVVIAACCTGKGQ